MRGVIKWLMIAFLIGMGLLVLDRWISAPIVRVTGDALDWRSNWSTGAGGIDCGRVKAGADAHAATNCALRANAEGKPFRVRYDILGGDSNVAVAIVRGSDGRVATLTFTGNPASSGGTSLWRQRVSKSFCPEPIHLWVNSKGRINCFQQQLSPSKNLASPTAGPH